MCFPAWNVVGYSVLTRLGLVGSGTFTTFSVACFAGYFWATYVVPETASISLEEMDAVFGSSAGLEDMQLKHQVRSRGRSAEHMLILPHRSSRI